MQVVAQTGSARRRLASAQPPQPHCSLTGTSPAQMPRHICPRAATLAPHICQSQVKHTQPPSSVGLCVWCAFPLRPGVALQCEPIHIHQVAWPIAPFGLRPRIGSRCSAWAAKTLSSAAKRTLGGVSCWRTSTARPSRRTGLASLTTACAEAAEADDISEHRRSSRHQTSQSRLSSALRDCAGTPLPLPRGCHACPNLPTCPCRGHCA